MCALRYDHNECAEVDGLSAELLSSAKHLFTDLLQFVLGCAAVAITAGPFWGHALREFADGEALPSRARVRALSTAGQHALYGVAISTAAFVVRAAAYALPGKEITMLIGFGGTFLAAGGLNDPRKCAPAVAGGAGVSRRDGHSCRRHIRGYGTPPMADVG